MDNYQKKIFIEYFLNSIDKIKINLANSIQIWELFDIITEEFSLTDEVKNYLNDNFSLCKNLDEIKFKKSKTFLKEKLKEILKKLEYTDEESYKILNKIKEDKNLSQNEYKILVYYTFRSNHLLFQRLSRVLLLPDYSESNVFYSILKILNSIGINITRKLLKLNLLSKEKYGYFKYMVNNKEICKNNYDSLKFGMLFKIV